MPIGVWRFCRMCGDLGMVVQYCPEILTSVWHISAFHDLDIVEDDDLNSLVSDLSIHWNCNSNAEGDASVKSLTLPNDR